MQPLATNFIIWQQLRSKYSWALSLFPVGLMFGAFFPIFWFAQWLSIFLEIQQGVPVKEQSNGLLWLILFLVTMVLLMLAGSALGWLLNAVIARILFRWPIDKIHEVFLYSRVPVEWYRNADSRETISKASKRIASRAVTRKKGKWHFVFITGVLRWGSPMFFAMSCVPVLTNRVQPTLNYFVQQGLIWGTAGAIFGFTSWHFIERSFKRQAEESKQ